MVMGCKLLFGQIATEELALSETRLAGGQKQNRAFPRSILLLECLL